MFSLGSWTVESIGFINCPSSISLHYIFTANRKNGQETPYERFLVKLYKGTLHYIKVEKEPYLVYETVVMTTTKGLYELFQKDMPPDKTLYQIEDYAVLETLRPHFLNILINRQTFSIVRNVVETTV